jgi:hypothetical protein
MKAKSTRVGSVRNELKINIENMVRCGGSCSGCILTSSERVYGSVWPQATFDRATSFVQAFVADHIASGTPFHEISVAFGQGDHFLLDAADADRIVRWASELSPGRVVGFITASAIGKRERIMRSVDAWAEAMHRYGQALNVDMVLDPTKVSIDAFSPVYADNISHIKQTFGDFDLNINVGPDTPRAVSPEALRSFVMANGFSRLTLNLVPLPGMATAFAKEWTAVSEWLLGCLNVWRPEHGYDLNFCPTIAPLIEGANQRLFDQGMRASLSFVEERLSREIYIDGDGRVSHTQAGFGDVPLSHRFGFEPTFDIDVEAGRAATAVKTSARRFSTQIAAWFASKAACGDCRFMHVCPKIGAVALGKSLGGSFRDTDCPTGLKPMLKGIEAFMSDGSDLATTCYTDARVHVPHDFDISLLPNSKRVKPHVGKVDLAELGQGS